MSRPLIELHSHLEGTITAETFMELARNGREHLVPTWDPHELAAALASPGREGFSTYFRLTRPFRTGVEDARLFTRAELNRAQSLGVVYAEYRFNPMGPAGRGTDPRTILEAIRGEMDAIEGGTELRTGLIAGFGRSDDASILDRFLGLAREAWRDGLICGVDLNGDEAVYPTAGFVAPFQAFGRTGCPLTVHAGEWDGPESVWAALRCGASRIGHGVRAAEDEALVETLARDEVTLEVCPTSNVSTEVYSSMDEVPLRKLFDRGVPVTINSDDSAAFGTDISREFAVADTVLGFSGKELDEIRRNAARSAFLSGPERADLVLRVQDLLSPG